VRLHGIATRELDQTFWWRGRADSVRHHVVGRPRGTHSRGQGALRGDRARPAWSPRSSRPIGSASAAGWCRRGRRIDGTRRTTSTPKTRPGRPGAECGGAPSSNPGSGAHHHPGAYRRPCRQLRPGRNGSRPDRDCAIVCTSGSGQDVGPAWVSTCDNLQAAAEPRNRPGLMASLIATRPSPAHPASRLGRLESRAGSWFPRSRPAR
jgi:hypothetical protein